VDSWIIPLDRSAVKRSVVEKDLEDFRKILTISTGLSKKICFTYKGVTSSQEIHVKFTSYPEGYPQSF